MKKYRVYIHNGNHDNPKAHLIENGWHFQDYVNSLHEVWETIDRFAKHFSGAIYLTASIKTDLKAKDIRCKYAAGVGTTSTNLSILVQRTQVTPAEREEEAKARMAEAEMESNQLIDDLIAEIMAEAKRPVTSQEVDEFNATFGFGNTDAFELLAKQAEIENKFDQAIGNNEEAWRIFCDNGHQEWRKAFQRYTKSAAWKEQLNAAIQNKKQEHASNAVNFGKTATVIKVVESIRSAVPAVGQTGTIMDGDFEYNPGRPEDSAYMYHVRFSLPCRLADGGLYVNEDILSEEEATSEYMRKHGYTSVIWQKDNEDSIIAWFTEDEIEIG